jgi:hypothetical protein
MNRTFLWFRICVAATLVAAVGEWPASFYALVRVATTVAAVEVAWVAYTRKQPQWVLPFASAAILWNPIRQIRLPQDTWRILDLIAAALFALSLLYVRNVALFTRRADRATRVPYLALTFISYGSVLLVTFGAAALPKSQGPLDEPWQSLLLVIVIVLFAVVIAEKFVYIRHAITNPNVRYKVAWTVAILLLHFWAELFYYVAHIRQPAAAAPTAQVAV